MLVIGVPWARAVPRSTVVVIAMSTVPWGPSSPTLCPVVIIRSAETAVVQLGHLKQCADRVIIAKVAKWSSVLRENTASKCKLLALIAMPADTVPQIV